MCKIKHIDGIEFREVLGFPGYYVSTSGTIMSYHNGHRKIILNDKPHQLRPSSDPRGYRHVVFYQNKQWHTRRVHRVVLETFVGLRPVGMECRHLDGSRDNNHIDNLTWGTPSENCADRIRHGRDQYGERGPGSKLTKAQVVTIRRIRAKSNTTYKTISQRFGVSMSLVGLIVRRKCWKYI